MLLVVPDAGAYDGVRSKLSSDAVSEIAAHAGATQVNLTVPKFNVRSTIAAKEVLQSLGMTTPFIAGSASFPKLGSDVSVSDVLHQATVTIDEKGTEAAAATAILEVTLGVSLPDDPKVVTVDRPFLFVIRDNSTGAALFVGQVVAP
jgi:serpin B